MGYESYVQGDLTCAPALSDKVLENCGWGEDGVSDLWARTVGEPETVGLLPNGEIGVIPGTQHNVIECRYDQRYKAYDLETQVRTLVNEAIAAGSKVNGRLYVTGEESQDIWRIRVEDNTVHVESPKLLWPNGDEEDPF